MECSLILGSVTRHQASLLRGPSFLVWHRGRPAFAASVPDGHSGCFVDKSPVARSRRVVRRLSTSRRGQQRPEPGLTVGVDSSEQVAGRRDHVSVGLDQWMGGSMGKSRLWAEGHLEGVGGHDKSHASHFVRCPTVRYLSGDVGVCLRASFLELPFSLTRPQALLPPLPRVCRV